MTNLTTEQYISKLEERIKLLEAYNAYLKATRSPAGEREQMNRAIVICQGNGGQSLYNYGQAAAIMGCHRNRVAHNLNKSGILVHLRDGTSGQVSAYDLAYYEMSNRTTPIQ